MSYSPEQNKWAIDNGYTGYEDYLNNQKSGNQSSGGTITQNNPPIPAFKFDWAAARQQALDQLTPYYEQKLTLAKGDVELAKKYIEEDYQRGLRYKTDTYAAQEKYNQAEGANQLAQEQIAQTEETRNTQGEANKRGTMIGQLQPGQSGAAPTSDYYNTYIGDPTAKRQALRTEAIKRAVQKQSEIAGIQQTKDIGELGSQRAQALNQQDTGYRNLQLEAGQEKQEKATNVMAPLKYQEAYSQYQASKPSVTG